MSRIPPQVNHTPVTNVMRTGRPIEATRQKPSHASSDHGRTHEIHPRLPTTCHRVPKSIAPNHIRLQANREPAITLSPREKLESMPTNLARLHLSLSGLSEVRSRSDGSSRCS